MAPGEPGTRYHKKSNLENPDTNGRDPASPPRWPGNNIMIVRIGLGSWGVADPPGDLGSGSPQQLVSVVGAPQDQAWGLGAAGLEGLP